MGEKLQTWSFLLGLVGSLLLLVSLVLGFVGTRISDKGYWESIRTIFSDIRDAKTRKEPQWTPFVQVKSEKIPKLDKPIKVTIQFQLFSSDNTIPLMVRVAADKDGHYSSTVAGPAGVVEQLIIEPQTYYVSISHPSITWNAAVLRFHFPR